jgi:hypothetical protein
MIDVGERYQHASWIWDGEPSDFKTCASCAAIREWLTAEMRAGRVYDREGCGVSTFGCLAEECTEALNEWLCERYLRCGDCDSGWSAEPTDQDPACPGCAGRGWIPRSPKP